MYVEGEGQKCSPSWVSQEDMAIIAGDVHYSLQGEDWIITRVQGVMDEASNDEIKMKRNEYPLLISHFADVNFLKRHRCRLCHVGKGLLPVMQISECDLKGI